MGYQEGGFISQRLRGDHQVGCTGHRTVPYRNRNAFDSLRLQRGGHSQKKAGGFGRDAPGCPPVRWPFLCEGRQHLFRLKRIAEIEHLNARRGEPTNRQHIRSRFGQEQELIIQSLHAPGIAHVQRINQHPCRQDSRFPTQFYRHRHRTAAEIRSHSGLREPFTASPLLIRQQLPGHRQTRAVVQRGGAVIRTDQMRRHFARPHCRMLIHQRDRMAPSPGRVRIHHLVARPYKIVIHLIARQIGLKCHIFFRVRRVPEPRIRRHQSRRAILGLHRQPGTRGQKVHIAVRIGVAIGLPDKAKRGTAALVLPRHNLTAARQRQLISADRRGDLRFIVSRQHRCDLRRRQPVESVFFQRDTHARALA